MFHEENNEILIGTGTTFPLNRNRQCVPGLLGVPAIVQYGPHGMMLWCSVKLTRSAWSVNIIFHQSTKQLYSMYKNSCLHYFI